MAPSIQRRLEAERPEPYTPDACPRVGISKLLEIGFDDRCGYCLRTRLRASKPPANPIATTIPAAHNASGVLLDVYAASRRSAGEEEDGMGLGARDGIAAADEAGGLGKADGLWLGGAECVGRAAEWVGLAVCVTVCCLLLPVPLEPDPPALDPDPPPLDPVPDP